MSKLSIYFSIMFVFIASKALPALALSIGVADASHNLAREEGVSCGSLSQRLSSHRAQSLFRTDADGGWRPEIASRWKNDGTLVSVDMNPSATATADDVLASLRAWQGQSEANRIVKVEKASSTQVTIEYRYPIDAAFPVELCLVGILSSQKRSENRVTIEHVPMLEKAIEKLSRDEIQFWLKDTFPKFLTRGLLLHAQGISIYKTASPYTTVLRFGKRNFLSDPKIRYAIAQAINRNEIIKFSLENSVVLTDDIFFNAHPLYIAGSKLNFDPQKSKEIFLKKKETVIIATEASDKFLAAAKGIAVQLKRVDLSATVKVFTKSTELINFAEICEKCVALIQIPHTATNTLRLLGLNQTTLTSKNLMQNFESMQSDARVLPLWNDWDQWLANSTSPKNKNALEEL